LPLSPLPDSPPPARPPPLLALPAAPPLSALFVSGTFLGRDRLAALRAAAPDLKIETTVVIPVEPGSSVATDAHTLNWADLGPAAESVTVEEAERRAREVEPDDLSGILVTPGPTGRRQG